MSRYDGRLPPLPPLGHGTDGNGGGAGGWDDWDPSAAHTGLTGKVRAVPGLDLRGVLSPTPRAPASGPMGAGGRTLGAGALGPAGLAASARAATQDYLTVEYDVDDAGFLELYEAVIVPQWSLPFGRLLLSLFLTQSRHAGWQVLDVACGTGYPTVELARYVGQDCDIAGLDPWEAGIRRARQKASDEWLRNVSFIAADVTDSRIPDGTFDTITCNLGLPSFADPRAAVGAMARLLHPGGTLILTTPLQTAMREFLDTYYLTLRDLKLTDYMHALEGVIAARPTVAHARSLLESLGFTVERTVTDSFTLTFADERAFLTSPLVHTTYMGAWRSIISDMTVRRLVFNEIERRLRARTAASGGALKLTVPMLCVLARRL